MEFADYPVREQFLPQHRVFPVLKCLFHLRYFANRCIGCQGKVLDDEIVFEGHDLAVHFLGHVVQPDCVAPGFAHFPAVGTLQKRISHDKGFFAAQIFLEDSSGLHVKRLVRASQLDIRIHEVTIVSLHHGVEYFVESDVSAFRQAFFDELAAEKIPGGEMVGKFDNLIKPEFFEPFAVMADLHFGKIEDFLGLLFVCLEVFLDLC